MAEDLRTFLERQSGRIAGECEPLMHPSVERVIVVLNRTGELSRVEMEQVAEFAKAAAVAAGRVR